MTKQVAFCVISNRPSKMLQCAKTFVHGMVSGADNFLCLSLQPPYTAKDVSEITSSLPSNLNVRVDYRNYDPNEMFNCCLARQHSYQMAKDIAADYIIHIDDDFRFTDGQSTTLYQWRAGDRYLDAIQYLEEQPSCGMVLTKAFLGGTPVGRWILPMKGGFFETGTGIVLRNKNRPYENLIDERFVTPGAGEDLAICMTSMMHGYYVAKALNVTVCKDPNKKVLIKKGKSDKHLVNDNAEAVKSGGYDMKYLESGIIRKIKDEFGDFTLGSNLPPVFVNEYRKRAKALGFIVMF